MPKAGSISPMLNALRIFGLIEGCSTILLFFVAMPLKYLADMPAAVSIVGSIHGGLFLIYWALGMTCWMSLKWPAKRGIIVLGAAIIPFGPFILDKSLKKEIEERNAAGGSPNVEPA